MQFPKHLILKARAWPNVSLLWTMMVITMRAGVEETEAVTIRETKLFTVSRMQTSGRYLEINVSGFPKDGLLAQVFKSECGTHSKKA